MPRASSIIPVGRPFVALVALARETLASAGASSSAHLPKAAAKVGSGCPPFGGHRTVASARTREDMQLYRSTSRPQSECQASSRLHGRQPWRSGFFSQYPSTGSAQALLVQFAPPALVCFAIQIQSTVAAPRAWPTLPSSGRAFGTPLKSNVSRQLPCSFMPSRPFTSVRFVIRSPRSVKTRPFVGSIASEIESPPISAAQVFPVLSAYWQQQ